MKFGIIEGETKESYHECAAVGSHKLGDFVESPLLYQRRYLTKEAPLDSRTKALAFGDAFHTLALEGEAVFDSRHIILPDDAPDRPTAKMREAKKPKQETLDRIAWWDDFTERAGNRIITSQADVDLAWKMLRAIRAKPTAVRLLSHGKPELTFRKQMASFPIQCRCDWYDDALDEYQRPTILDVKTIESLADFDHQFLKFGYYKQAGFYSLVVQSVVNPEGAYPRFYYVVCEKNEPFQVAIREPDQISLDIGRREVMRDLARLKACYDTGIFPGEPDEIKPVTLPEWKVTKAIV